MLKNLPSVHMIDEIEDPSDPPALVLKHLNADLLNALATQWLTRLEKKRILEKVLKAIKVLHKDGYVHIGVVGTVSCGEIRVFFSMIYTILADAVDQRER